MTSATFHYAPSIVCAVLFWLHRSTFHTLPYWLQEVMWARSRNPSNGTADRGQRPDPNHKMVEGHRIGFDHTRTSPGCFRAQQNRPSTQGSLALSSQPTNLTAIAKLRCRVVPVLVHRVGAAFSLFPPTHKTGGVNLGSTRPPPPAPQEAEPLLVLAPIDSPGAWQQARQENPQVSR